MTRSWVAGTTFVPSDADIFSDGQPPFVTSVIGARSNTDQPYGGGGGELDVTMHGVVADAVINASGYYSGTDNSSAFLGALAEANSLGLDVLIPAGRYYVRSNLATYDGMCIRGAGKDKTILYADPTATITVFPIPVGAVRRNFRLEDMTIDGQVQFSPLMSTAAGLGVSGYAFENLQIRRVKIQNGRGYGVGLQGYPFAATGKQGPQIGLLMDSVDLVYCGVAKIRQTTLVNAIGPSDTSITVGDYTQLDASGGTIQVEDELMKHGAVTGATISVTRGRHQTTAASHAAGTALYRLSGGDGIDIKSGSRHTFINCYAERCPDKGFNPRARFTTMQACRAAYCNQGFGLNALGEDEDIWTTLTSSVTATDTTFSVASTASFPSSGVALVDSEVVTFSGKTSTTLTGVVRGAQGSTATTHASDAGVGWDQQDINHDVSMAIIGCGAEYCDTALSVASGNIATTMNVDVQSFAAFQCTNGLNLSSGSKGASRANGRLRATITGGFAANCTGDGLIASNCDDICIVGFRANNCDTGIRLLDQTNGGYVTAYNLRNNTHAYVEQGDTQGVVRGDGIVRGNGSSFTLGTNHFAHARYTPETDSRMQVQASLPLPSTDFGTVAAGAFASTTVTFTGVSVGDAVVIAYSAALPAGVTVEAAVIGSANVRITLFNDSASPVTLGALGGRLYAFRTVSL